MCCRNSIITSLPCRLPILLSRLRDATAAEDTVAEERTWLTQGLHFADEVLDFKLDAVPATRLGLGSFNRRGERRLPSGWRNHRCGQAQRRRRDAGCRT